MLKRQDVESMWRKILGGRLLSMYRKKRAQRRDRMVSAGRGWRRIWRRRRRRRWT